MPKDILDIVDTAVKIGLGALISGVTTYVITHKSHSNELAKENRDKKASILEFSVENIEPFFNAFENFLSVIDGQLRMGNPPGKKSNEEWEELKFWEDDEKLVSTRDIQSVSISRLNLIGLTKLTDQLLLIKNIENDFRQKVVFEQVLPSAPELASYRAKYKKAKQKFYNALNSSFESLYC